MIIVIFGSCRTGKKGRLKIIQGGTTASGTFQTHAKTWGEVIFLTARIRKCEKGNSENRYCHHINDQIAVSGKNTLEFVYILQSELPLTVY
jgi:predicted RNA binding protein with dsRBD fold (UPF0201 family)